MSPRARILTPLVVAVLTLGFAGCATPAAEPTPVAPVSPDETAAASSPAAESPEPSPTAPVTADEIEGVRVGGPFSSETADIPGFETVEGCEWAGTAPRDGYSLMVLRDSDGTDDSPVVLVEISVPADAVSHVGPRTPEGIGIGSTLAEAQSAYPEAEVISSAGDRRHLKALQAEGSGLFLTYTEGADLIWSLAATSLDAPPYEPCA